MLTASTRLALGAFFALTAASFADSIAIYTGKLTAQEIYRHQTAQTPALTGRLENVYAIVRLGAGGDICFVTYGKKDGAKFYTVGGTQTVSLNYVTNTAKTKGQCVLTRGTTISNTPPPATIVSNLWAEGPLMPGLKTTAKLDRDWTRVLSIEVNYGYANLDGGTNDYFAFSKGFLVMENGLTKSANTANGGAPETFAAAVTRVTQLLQSKGYVAGG